MTSKTRYLFLSVLKHALLFLILTAFTQTGGLVYLLYLLIKKRNQSDWSGILGKLKQLGSFFVLYALFNLTITPLVAKYFNRVPMPIYHESKLKPANAFIWLANRHYVKPQLKKLLLETAQSLPSEQSIVYLDANFPWIDGFPMTGHLSHDDGEKIDLAFAYKNAEGKLLNTVRSLSGYGITTPPKAGETDQPSQCEALGYWQYSLPLALTYDRYPEYQFDYQANRKLLQNLALNTATGKIFIEPHLKERLNLQWFTKIRFHGCQAVRHDDHIHLQL
ncbi:MAG: hypothetical protein R8G66_00075 [Cytophagales bacterium]|nr:hypothetical protein [Cytophagales bacterium]